MYLMKVMSAKASAAGLVTDDNLTPFFFKRKAPDESKPKSKIVTAVEINLTINSPHKNELLLLYIIFNIKSIFFDSILQSRQIFGAFLAEKRHFFVQFTVKKYLYIKNAPPRVRYFNKKREKFAPIRTSLGTRVSLFRKLS